MKALYKVSYTVLQPKLFLLAGNPLANGLAMKYKDSCGEVQMMTLLVLQGQHRRKAQLWIASMQKVRTNKGDIN